MKINYASNSLKHFEVLAFLFLIVDQHLENSNYEQQAFEPEISYTAVIQISSPLGFHTTLISICSGFVGLFVWLVWSYFVLVLFSFFGFVWLLCLGFVLFCFVFLWVFFCFVVVLFCFLGIQKGQKYNYLKIC